MTNAEYSLICGHHSRSRQLAVLSTQVVRAINLIGIALFIAVTRRSLWIRPTMSDHVSTKFTITAQNDLILEKAMNTGTRRALTGSIHKIREFELEQVCLVEEFDILQIVGEGWFGKILLVEHRASDTEIVLKALPKPYVSIRDFYREFHYGLHLSAHKNIVTTFDVAFETAGFYVFCQEYAPLGDLTSNMFDTGIGEIHTKRVAKQLSAALEHLHQRELVHRDVKLDNVLIFKSDFSRIKVCDFGETRKVQSVVRRRNEWLPYSPPEVLRLAMDSSYKSLITHDVWQFGIVIFICLTGCLPWQKAAFDDPRYTSYYNWYNSANPLKKQPKLWKMVSSRAQKMFKKFIEPRVDKRATNFQELHRYLEDKWMAKGYTDRVAGGDIDELCPSMYSFHSDPNEKNILLRHFKENGIETTIDRQAKKQRIREWIQNSVIEEADEEEENYEASILEDSDSELQESRNHPIDEAHRVTLRFDTEKHINPRTGEVIEGAKPAQPEKNPLSYDVQNIEPVAPVNVVRRYGTKEESSSHSSTKDSAYGSMEGRAASNSNVNSFRVENKQVTGVRETSNRYSPSRSLSASSIQKNRSPMTAHAQRIQKTEEVYSRELKGSQGSSSTLHSSKSNSLKAIHNGSNESSSRNNLNIAHNGNNDSFTVVNNVGGDSTLHYKQNSSHQRKDRITENPMLQHNVNSSVKSKDQYSMGNNESVANKQYIQGSSQQHLNTTNQQYVQGSSQQQPSVSNPQIPYQPPQNKNNMSANIYNYSAVPNQQHSQGPSQQQYNKYAQIDAQVQQNEYTAVKNGDIVNMGTPNQHYQQGRSDPHQKKYISMKDTAYDNVNLQSENNADDSNQIGNQTKNGPYTSMMNIVQGQMQISPHGDASNQNIVNMSVTSVKDSNRIQRYSMIN